MKKIEESFEIGGRKLTLSAGHIAGQADGAVMVSYGETVVLATVVSSPLKEDRGYFPLTVEYQEKLYAGGRIKGSRWVKREGKPTDDEILTARLIDRSIRPLFPKAYNKDDVQVIATVLSVDLENSPDIVASTAVSVALSLSDIPWTGPVGTVRVGKNKEGFLLNPLEKDLEKSDLDLVVSSTKEAIVMIESGSNEVEENEIIKGIEFAQREIAKLIDFIDGFTKKAGVKKRFMEEKKIDSGLRKRVKELLGGRLDDLALKMATKEAGYAEYDELKFSVLESFEGESKALVAEIFESLFTELVRKSILSGKRLDGRGPEEIRELSAEVSILPRTHGSGLFSRGQTQVLNIATLGAPSLEQTIETAEGEETRRYIHHYTMPPFSVGETGRVGFPKRREIGHGALAERALIPVIPSQESFPYTIRVVSEVLSSNGSTSMASVCSSTLSLMDAGVPIKAPVAGIAMGLVFKSPKKFTILTDIAGIEDGAGDMDFKVAGTKDGITALQLDVKTLNLTTSILKEALAQAKGVRQKILGVLAKAIDKPRSSVSPYAPNIKIISIDVNKIGELIGPGGKTIKSIIQQTGAQVDVEDDGSVFISALSEDAVQAAIERVEGLTKEVVPGEFYDGEVKRLENFGAFVEILPGKDGLVHVSDMSQDFVKDPSDIVKVGDRIKVRVKEVDNLGRINLSMLLDGDKKRSHSRDQQGRNRRRGGSKNYHGRDRRFRNSPRQVSGGGPHFPASRLMDFDGKKKFSR